MELLLINVNHPQRDALQSFDPSVKKVPKLYQFTPDSVNSEITALKAHLYEYFKENVLKRNIKLLKLPEVGIFFCHNTNFYFR